MNETKAVSDELAAAEAVIAADKKRRTDAVQAGLNALLEEHKCVLHPQVVVGPGQNQSGVVIVPL